MPIVSIVYFYSIHLWYLDYLPIVSVVFFCSVYPSNLLVQYLPIYSILEYILSDFFCQMAVYQFYPLVIAFQGFRPVNDYVPCAITFLLSLLYSPIMLLTKMFL